MAFFARGALVRIILGFSLALAPAASSADPSAHARQVARPQTADQKIYMAQINPIIGDVEHNLALVEAAYRDAVAKGADVFMTPEMALWGYPARDLTRNEEMIPRIDWALERLKKLSAELRTPDGRSVMIAVGHPARNKQKRGKPFRNQTSIIENGKVVHEHYKRLLPNYDIFDEDRYYEPGTTTKSFEKNGVVYAILNCEEGWFYDTHKGRIIYKKDPADDLKKLADAAHAAGKKFMILDTSASPWVRGKPPVREDLHADVVRRTGADGMAYTNMWGGNDSILFDAHSFVMGKGGTLLGRLKGFGDSSGIVNVPAEPGAGISLANPEAFHTAPSSVAKQTRQALVMGIRDYFRKTGQTKAIVGNSGGIDCADVLSLLAEAIGPENVISVAMPGPHSSESSLQDAADLAERLHIEHRVEPIMKHAAALSRQLKLKNDIALQNVQARMRGAILQNLGNEVGAMIVGTGNKAEYFQGYATIFGDIMPLNPIIGLTKQMVYEVARQGNQDGFAIPAGRKVVQRKTVRTATSQYTVETFKWEYEKDSADPTGATLKREVAFNTIPDATISKAPSAELKPGQKDSDDLPVYEVLDQMVDDVIVHDMGPSQFLKKWGQRESWAAAPQDYDRWQANNQAGLKKVLSRYQWTEIKRMLSAVSMKVTPRDFGPGWQQVIAKHFYDRGLNGEFETPAEPAAEPKAVEPVAIRKEAVEIVAAVNQKFRSSDRYIPADTLRRQAVRAIGPELMVQLAQLSRGDIVAALQTLPAIDKGIAENLIKVHQMQHLCVNGCDFSDEHGDRVPGLPQDELDRLVSVFPGPVVKPADPNARAQIDRPSGEFDYQIHAAAERAGMAITNNDLYNFKVAAAYYGNGLHETKTATASLFSRGHKNRPFIVTMGQEQVLDMLKNLHITEEEIQFLKKNPQFKDVKPEFWDYLRNFKFKGSIRGVKPGTIVYGDEQILEITGNPVEVQIVETLVIPIINKMSNFATKAERVTRMAKGKLVVEGGSRRGADGFWSALAAYVGGAKGTSNAETAMRWGIPAYGSQNHFSIMMYDRETAGMGAFLRFFPEPATILADTNGPEQSVRAAMLAAGPSLYQIRLDSTLPGKTKAETAFWTRQTLDRMGYTHVKIGYSDGINEQELAELRKMGAPIDWFLVGTELAAPSDTSNLNVVYKVTEVVDNATGKVFDPIKKAVGKLSLPGRHDLWRQYQRVKRKLVAGRGYVSETGEPGPKGAKNLTFDLMVKGEDVLKRETLDAQQASVPRQVSELPKEQLALDAPQMKNYFDISPKLQARQEAAKARVSTEGHPKKVFVIPGSFSPVTESHLKLILGMRELFEADEVVIVPSPSGAGSTNGKVHMFSDRERIEMLKRALGGSAAMKKKNIRISTHDLDVAKVGGKAYTFDTLESLKAEYAARSENVDLNLVVGEDNIKSFHSWHRFDELLDNYNVVFSPRDPSSDIKIDHKSGIPDFMRFFPPEVQAKYQASGALRAENPTTHTSIQYAYVGVGPGASTAIRDRIGAVDTVYMDIDTLQTFWKGMHGNPDGALAVGTADTAAGAAKMKRLGYADPRGKVVTIRDTHHPAEIAPGSDQNLEFTPTADGGFGLPPHSQFRTKGPAGDQPIQESEIFSKDQQHTVAHLRERDGKLVAAPVNLDRVADKIRDPDTETIVEKSGSGINPRTGAREGSWGAGANPHFESVLHRIGAKRYVLWGVCTDICVDRTLLDTIKIARAQNPDAEFIVIKNAIAAFDGKEAEKDMAEWKKDGVKLMTSEEYVATYRPELKPVLELAPDLKAKDARNSIAACLRDSLGSN